MGNRLDSYKIGHTFVGGTLLTEPPYCKPPIDLRKLRWVLLNWREEPTCYGSPQGPYGDRTPYYRRHNPPQVTVVVDDGCRRTEYVLIRDERAKPAKKKASKRRGKK